MLIKRFDELEKLNEAIAKVLHSMSDQDPETEEYRIIADQLTKLMKVKQIIAELKLKALEASNKKTEIENTARLKEMEILSRDQDLHASRLLKADELALKTKESNKPDRVSRDTLALVVANLTGIALIIGYERVNVIASKALGFIARTR